MTSIQKNIDMRRWLWSIAVVLTLGLPNFVGVAHARQLVEAVSASLQDGAEVLRIDLSQTPEAVPAGFVTQSPPRIALDFSGVENATGRSLVEINQGNIRSANLVEGAGRLRVVLNLKQSTSYRAELHGNAVLVWLDPVTGGGQTSASTSGSTAVFAGGRDDYATDSLPLKELDFRRGADGAGRVIVGLGGSQIGVDLKQQGAGLVVDFMYSSLPEDLRRRLDVSDFGTPVQMISAVQQGERVRLTIDSVGDWEHSAYQSDSQFVVEVRPRRIDPNKLTQGPHFSGEKLSLNFQDVEIRSLLQVIAEFTNFNIVTSDTVAGNVTLRLQDVPWDQALQIIMDAKGLGLRKTGTVLWIAPKDEIDERVKKDYEAIQAQQQLEPVRTQTFQLNYAKATEVVGQFTKAGGGEDSAGRFLSERGSAMAEPRTNQLFVTDIPQKLEAVRELLAVLDVPVRQVMIEARIVEARDTFGRTLGVRLGGGDLRAARGGDGGYKIGGGHRAVWGSDYANATGAGLGGGAGGGTFVNLPGRPVAGGEGMGTFALSIFSPSANRFLTMELSAMEADGQGKIVSSPRLITADQSKAVIEQGTEYPVVTPGTADTPPTVTFKRAVLKLEVTPQITPEGDVILNLNVNKDSRGEISADGNPAINTRMIETQVLVENGGTVVIGGIFEMEESTQQTRVPLLGEIPVLGNLFRNKLRESEKREMLVFVTPKVVTDGGAIR